MAIAERERIFRGETYNVRGRSGKTAKRTRLYSPALNSFGIAASNCRIKVIFETCIERLRAIGINLMTRNNGERFGALHQCFN